MQKTTTLKKDKQPQRIEQHDIENLELTRERQIIKNKQLIVELTELKKQQNKEAEIEQLKIQLNEGLIKLKTINQSIETLKSKTTNQSTQLIASNQKSSGYWLKNVSLQRQIQDYKDQIEKLTDSKQQEGICKELLILANQGAKEYGSIN